MGNQLSGIAPAQILGVENYFIDLPEFRFESSLGSTRFLKVARAKHKEGYVVIKVFVIHDPSLPLFSYQDHLNQIAKLTAGFPNVLPFQKSLLTDRVGLLIRQYVHDNLYDRISTRPFLNIIEKKWIAFQLLCALEQIHNVKVCHGDIKTNNIMITSWDWALLTDIASFKPVFVPADNPADFNYFFDTSRRRMCYLAPERFVDLNSRNAETAAMASGNFAMGVVGLEDSNKQEIAQSSISLPMQDLPETSTNGLTEVMDIFSAGCVISELFCDGVGLFDLSQLLAYRTGDFNPDLKLAKLDDNIKDMIKHMIQLNPMKRLPAKEYLSKYRGSIFPEEFYSFLRNYFTSFASTPVLTADEKIAKIAKDMEMIKNALYNARDDDKQDTLSGDEYERREIPENDNCFVMIVSLVTSCVRSLRFSISKLTSLDLMLELAHYVSDEIILELLLPYMFFLVHDNVPRVCAKSITTISKCVQLVTILPKNEVNIFPEYILPNLSLLADDPEVLVQCAFAENISLLAETALRFLELAQLSNSCSDRDDQSQYQVLYDVELHALHELIQNKVVSLLTNTNNIVKRTLMENGLTRLCVFFGRQKANDVLLSHIITFLNDKHDWQIRAAFFDSIVGVAVYIGCQCLTILKPLLQQGLKDAEEFVVVSALKALMSLVELGLLQKPIIYDFIVETTCFLCHPNRWIRYAAIGYVVACAKVMSLADVQCRLAPSVLPYLKQPIIQFDNQTVLLSVLDDPIPRAIYDYIIRSQQAWVFLSRLEQHHEQNSETQFVPSSHEALSQIVRKLKSQGMNYKIEKKIIKLKEIIIRLNNYKSNPDIQQTQDLVFPGLLDLSALGNKPKSREKDLRALAETKAEAKMLQTSSKRTSKHTNTQQGQQSSTEKENETDDPTASAKFDHTETSGKSTTPMYTAMTDQAKYAKCKVDVRTLVHYKRDQYVADTKKQSLLGAVMENKSKQTCWKPSGQLVAHLHEHKAAINRVVLSDDHRFFATASDDSTVKIWDTSRLDGKALATRSKYNYTKQVGKINCLTFCQGSKTLACSSDDASIHVFRIDGGSGSGNRLPLLIEKKLNLQDEGCAVDMHQFDTGSQSLIAYATVHGYICGWDLRQPKEKFAWKLKNDTKLGLISSFAVDSLQCWTTCGTSDGALVCWDMRFQLPITQIVHRENARIRRVCCHPVQPSWIVASFQGNNEVSMWDLETSAKRQTLWASQHPPLTYSQPSHDTVLAMHGSSNGKNGYFITAGTDKRIRFWDLAQPSESSIIAGSATDNLDHVTLKCVNRMIDGTEVFYESYEKKRPTTGFDERPIHGTDEPPAGHHDCITDMAVTKHPQNFLITCSKDGVVKVWK